MMMGHFYRENTAKLQAIFCWFLLFLITAIYFNGTRFLPNEADFRDNLKYLSDLKFRGLKDASINQFLFGSEGLGNFSEKYYSLEREYDYQRKWGLLDASSERVFYNRHSQLSQEALGAMKGYHESYWSKALTKGIKDKLDLTGMKTPGMILLAAAAIYTGRTLEQKVSDNVLLKSRTSMNNAHFMGQTIGVESPLASGSLEYCDADYKVGLSKTIGLISASAGASYAIQSQTRTLNFSKQLTEHVGVSYDQANSQQAPTSHTLGIGFSTGF
jgi:hypothetical protein